jgi:hypothetical protein
MNFGDYGPETCTSGAGARLRHLLDDFAALKARCEVGIYGGERIAFFSMAALHIKAITSYWIVD